MQPSQTIPDQPCFLNIEMLTRLGQVVGLRFDTERLQQLLITVANRAPGDPLAHLALAAEELGLRLTPYRMSLSEAVWQAEQDAPVILWCEPEQQFLIITYASEFKVRLAQNGRESMDSVTISRARLATRMGLGYVGEKVEVGLIHHQSPERAASSETQSQDAARAGKYATKSHRNEHDDHHGSNDGHGAHHAHMSPFHRFLKILKPERRDILMLIVFAVFSGILYLAVPLAVETVVTTIAFGGQAKPYLQALVVISQILAITLFLQAMITAFQHYIAELIQRRIFVRTAADLAYRLPRVNSKAFDGVHGPEMVNRFMDVVTIQKNTAYFLLEGINVLAASLIGMALLALYHPTLLAFVALLIIMIIAGTWLLGRKAVTTSIQESRTKYDLVGWFEEIAAFPFLFKGPGGYEMAYQRTNVLASEYVHARSQHFRVLFRQIIGLLVLSVFASVALLFMGTWLVLSQQLTLGQLVASELIMSGIVVSVVKLGKKFESWYDTMAATDKVGHLLDLETEVETGEKPTITDKNIGMSVAAKDLGFGYDGGSTLFSDRNFELKPGDRVGLFGPQGSGVSTILDLLFAMRQPTSGHLSFDGLDSRNWHLESLRSQVQLLRRDEFVDGTVIENMRLGRSDIALEEIRAAIEKVGLLDELLGRPEGLNLRLSVGGSPMSTSQRISLLVARALVQRPRLLLIDELFDGFEDSTLKLLTEIVLLGNIPWTVVIATRMPDILVHCNQTIELKAAKHA